MRILMRLIPVCLVLCATFQERAMAVEEPPYDVTLHDGAFEVRSYPSSIVAEVTVGGDQDSAASAGFRLLAHYLFGGNRPQQSLAMTAPVAQFQAGDTWTVRFFMPRNETLASLPVPDDSRVHLRALPAGHFAVVRFSGLAYAGDVAHRTAELESFMMLHHLRAAGPPVLARYNPPWTLWLLRRNEVMIPTGAPMTPATG